MALKTPQDLDNTIAALRDGAAPTDEMIADMTAARDALSGFILAAQRLNLSGVYGILRGHIAEDAGSEARDIRACFEILENAGVSTEEDDLSSLLETGAT